MKNAIWRMLARAAAKPRVADWFIARAKRTPYLHLPEYMERWWLFNGFQDNPRYVPWLPSIRVHHILREDLDRALHDHPWDARTIILKGWYVEEREDGSIALRDPGDTARINFGEYHSIRGVCAGGVWTMFITWKYRAPWGFKVNGQKVLWREYLARKEDDQ